MEDAMPVFLDHPKLIKARLGDTAVLTCETRSNIFIERTDIDTIMKDGKNIYQQTNKIDLSYWMNDTKPISRGVNITIYNITMDDYGTYDCHSYNWYAEANFIIELTGKKKGLHTSYNSSVNIKLLLLQILIKTVH